MVQQQIPRQRGGPPALTTKPEFDVTYLRRLRARMRTHLLAAEAASVDLESLNAQHEERVTDPGRQFINKRDDTFGLSSVRDEYEFHRDAANMYSAALSAELASRTAIGNHRG